MLQPQETGAGISSTPPFRFLAVIFPVGSLAAAAGAMIIGILFFFCATDGPEDQDNLAERLRTMRFIRAAGGCIALPGFWLLNRAGTDTYEQALGRVLVGIGVIGPHLIWRYMRTKR